MPISRIVFLLFFPACIAILFKQIIWGSELTHQLLAVGIFFFCIEQANMANQDLQQVADAKVKIKDSRLDNFQRVTIITIIIELTGFYLSSIWLGYGSILILIAIIWFNLFVKIKIEATSSDIKIKSWPRTERSTVLIADVMGLILVSLWILKIGYFWISWGLFAMAASYCCIKSLLFFKSFKFIENTRIY
ncbi:hypothetical protein NIES267_30720 [Calothrix parasitica NIES-267]|uniref:Integral membrane protein n=1 Tax=Calothrix parasitica NIES-267 TaxID=1973488 RepID=A0A1Z4LQV7_9CYAN|nr:hypothetical protein NIES267_30720 [Calothrix parasitica NIES-267]